MVCAIVKMDRSNVHACIRGGFRGGRAGRAPPPPPPPKIHKAYVIQR